MNYDKLYTVKHKNNTQAAIELCSNQHPIFKAHFTFQPILPGFIHFEIVADLFGVEITSIKKAKFTTRISPRQTLEYEKKGDKFSVTSEGKLVASFTL